MGFWTIPVCVRAVGVDLANLRINLPVLQKGVSHPDNSPIDKMACHGVGVEGNLSVEESFMMMVDTAKIWGYVDSHEYLAWEWYCGVIFKQNPLLRKIEFHMYCSDEQQPFFVRAKRGGDVNWWMIPTGAVMCFTIEETPDSEDKKGRPYIFLQFESEVYKQIVLDRRNVLKLFCNRVRAHCEWHLQRKMGSYF